MPDVRLAFPNTCQIIKTVARRPSFVNVYILSYDSSKRRELLDFAERIHESNLNEQKGAAMGKLIRELDRILRGEATRPENLIDGTIKIPLGAICLAIILLGAIYGLCMSSYSAINRDPFDARQMIAPLFKVPALFFLTLLVTYPSLYVFNALVGSRLGLASLLRLIVASLAVTLMVLASFGTIIAFFSFTTKSYSFMILANVAVYAASGVLGLLFLLQTLNRITVLTELSSKDEPSVDEAPNESPDDTSNDAEPIGTELKRHADSPSALDPMAGHVLGRHVRAVFRIWVVVFGIVGAQMAWVLRPFIGDPDLPFSWFRQRESNFFESVWGHFMHLFS